MLWFAWMNGLNSCMNWLTELIELLHDELIDWWMNGLIELWNGLIELKHWLLIDWFRGEEAWSEFQLQQDDHADDRRWSPVLLWSLWEVQCHSKPGWKHSHNFIIFNIIIILILVFTINIIFKYNYALYYAIIVFNYYYLSNQLTND